VKFKGENKMGSFIKVFSVSLLLYFVLNLLLLIVYAAVGGYAMPIGDFFQLAIGDPLGFITMILQPGGISVFSYMPAEEVALNAWGSNTSFFAPFIIYIQQIARGYGNLAANIVGIIWVVAPGLLTALITGYKLSDESSKKAFWGTMLAFFLLNAIPMVFGGLGLLTGDLSTIYYIQPYYLNLTGIGAYFLPPFIFLFSSCFYGGFSAMASNNL
jgi:hypothetical protein